MGKAVINVRALSAVSAFASKDPVRLGLNGVCVEIDLRGVTYIATDGHRLLVHREELVEDADDNSLTGRFVIPTAQCRIHKTKSIPHGELSDEGDALTLTFDHVGIVFQDIGPFAEWRKVVPAKPMSGEPGQFNPEYAFTFQKFGKAMGIGAPVIAPDGEMNPALVRFADAPNTVGVLMPWKAPNAVEMPLPDWLRPAGEREAA